MNATTCSNVPAGARVLRTHRPWHQRLWAALAARWIGWRRAAEHRDAVNSLRELSDSTLRDIGLAEQMPPRRSQALDEGWFR